MNKYSVSRHAFIYTIISLAVLFIFALVSLQNVALPGILGFFIPKPSEVFHYILSHKDFINSLRITAYASCASIAFAIIFTITVLMVSIKIPIIRLLSDAFLAIAQTIPIIVFAPFLVIIFDSSYWASVAFSWLISVFPIASYTLRSATKIHASQWEVMRLFNAKDRIILRHVVTPAIIHDFFSGIRVSIPISIIGVLILDMSGDDMNATGLKLLKLVRVNQFDGVFAIVTLVIILSLFLIMLFIFIEVLFRLLYRHLEVKDV